MIIISASCRKSASTLIFDYQKDIVAASSSRNSLTAIRNFSRGTGYRGELNLKTFLILLYLNFRFGDVVLKTHGSPTIYIKLLVVLGLAKVTYSYRDPRDVVLSTLDHGIRTRKNMSQEEKEAGVIRNFSDVHSITDAISRVEIDVANWYKWQAFKNAFYIKYEDFIPNKYKYLKEICEYLNYNLSEAEIQTIYNSYESKKPRNFNKGTAGRYLEEMSAENIAICNKAFARSLVDMEYETNKEYLKIEH